MANVNAIEAPAWEHFHHGADIGIRGYGRSVEEAFEQAALALTAVIVDPTTVHPRRRIPLSAQAPDLEMLFVDWLNAIIYAMATRRMLFHRFQVDIAQDRLRGWAWGETVDRNRHRPAVEIKGATYTELKVTGDETGWCAQCVVDV